MISELKCPHCGQEDQADFEPVYRHRSEDEGGGMYQAGYRCTVCKGYQDNEGAVLPETP